MKVYNKQCENCLLSPDAIVSPERRKQIIDECKQKNTHFTCHIATLNGEDVCCKKFYDRFGGDITKIQILDRLGMVETVDQPASDKLPSYRELH